MTIRQMHYDELREAIGASNEGWDELVERLRSEGVSTIRAVVGPTPVLAEQAETMAQLGFRYVQDKINFWLEPPFPPTEQKRLSFRLLADVGSEQFREVIREVDKGALDDVVASGHGTDDYFTACEPENHGHLWYLGYDVSDHLVGLVQPAILYGETLTKEGKGLGQIFYIGVVPEQRGKGYIDDLFRHGIKVMIDEGIWAVGSLTDVRNVPMRRSHERLGFKSGDTFAYYLRDID